MSGFQMFCLKSGQKWLVFRHLRPDFRQNVWNLDNMSSIQTFAISDVSENRTYFCPVCQTGRPVFGHLLYSFYLKLMFGSGDVLFLMRDRRKKIGIRNCRNYWKLKHGKDFKVFYVGPHARELFFLIQSYQFFTHNGSFYRFYMLE